MPFLRLNAFVILGTFVVAAAGGLLWDSIFHHENIFAILFCLIQLAVGFRILQRESTNKYCCPSPTRTSSNTPPYLGERVCGNCGKSCEGCKEAMK